MADLKGDGQGNPSNLKANVIKSDLFGNKTGGNEWDDGQHSQIKKITATAGETIFTGFQLDYLDDGQEFHGATHGSKERVNAQYFDLDHSTEVVRKITGYYGKHDNIVKIKSLIFKTNTREFPAVGVAETSDKKFEIQGSNIIGLFGRADDNYVYSIGAYYYEA